MSVKRGILTLDAYSGKWILHDKDDHTFYYLEPKQEKIVIKTNPKYEGRIMEYEEVFVKNKSRAKLLNL